MYCSSYALIICIIPYYTAMCSDLFSVLLYSKLTQYNSLGFKLEGQSLPTAKIGYRRDKGSLMYLIRGGRVTGRSLV
jgi:hypothetical protein